MKRSRRRYRFCSGAETEGSKDAPEDYPQCSDPSRGCQLMRKESKPYRQAQKSPGKPGRRVVWMKTILSRGDRHR